MATKKTVINDALDSIYEVEGSLLPERVVELAKDRRHPLHGEFDWNDKTAAHEHRLSQARKMIRDYKVEVVTADEAFRVRVFFPRSYVGRDGGGYLHSKDITEQERPLLLRRLKTQLLTLQSQYGHLEEFLPMVREFFREEEAS